MSNGDIYTLVAKDPKNPPADEDIYGTAHEQAPNLNKDGVFRKNFNNNIRKV